MQRCWISNVQHPRDHLKDQKTNETYLVRIGVHASLLVPFYSIIVPAGLQELVHNIHEFIGHSVSFIVFYLLI